MIPIDFPQANLTLGAGGLPNTTPLRVWTNGKEIISCWQPDAEQVRKIAAGEPIFLCVMGSSMPPVWLDSGSPFADPSALAEDDAIVLREMGIKP